MTDEESEGIIIVTVGLPGAGKTTICRAIASELSKDAGIVCRHVCYDEMLNDRDSWDQPGFSWKSERQNILEEVTSWLSRTIQNQSAETSRRRIWVLIDDNMYYRSMRYPYFQLAREHRMAYAQLFITCSTETALRQNESRPSKDKVTSKVIERMNSRLQRPAPEEHTWEKWTVFIDKMMDRGTLEWILDQLRDASSHAAPASTIVDCEEKERQRQMTKESLLHQADLMLRRIVSEYCKNCSTANKSSYQESLRKTKLRIFEEMKSGSLDLAMVARQDIDSMRVLFGDFLASGCDSGCVT